jgi:drug/metabolite transporter (DMT)-like permease
MIVMIVSALAAAALYGAGAAIEQRQASAAPQSAAGRPRLLLLLARQPLWLMGIAAQIGGFAAHAVALRSGPLATVQMLVAGELVVAVVIVRFWSGRPLSKASWAAALTVVAAIAAFLVLTTSAGHAHAGNPTHHAVGAAAAVGAAVAGACAVASAVAGLRAKGRRRAILLAVAAGLADSCSAVVTLAFSHVASHGLVAVVTSWSVYALVVSGAGNVLLTQSAYQTGRPMITLPIISAVAPVASVAIGIGILGETPKTGVLGGVAAGAAVLVTSLALACLARLAPPPEAPEAPEVPKAPAAPVQSSRPVPSQAPEPDQDPEFEPVLAGCGAGHS